MLGESTFMREAQEMALAPQRGEQSPYDATIEPFLERDNESLAQGKFTEGHTRHIDTEPAHTFEIGMQPTLDMVLQKASLIEGISVGALIWIAIAVFFGIVAAEGGVIPLFLFLSIALLVANYFLAKEESVLSHILNGESLGDRDLVQDLFNSGMVIALVLLAWGVIMSMTDRADIVKDRSGHFSKPRD